MNETFETLANLATSIGLIITVVYSSKAVRAARIESEINAFSAHSNRYNEIIEELMIAKKFQISDWDQLGETKFKIYALFDIFSVIYATKQYQTEIGKTFWDHWDRRINFLSNKPAVRIAWARHRKDQDKLYSNDFIEFMNSKLS